MLIIQLPLFDIFVYKQRQCQDNYNYRPPKHRAFNEQVSLLRDLSMSSGNRE